MIIMNNESIPQHVSTLISDVYIFDTKVFKVYKRDVEWWNRDMTDLSGGQSRIDFITSDFKFNNALNPEVYIDLQVPIANGDFFNLRSPEASDDELIIVMNKVDVSNTLTKVLSGGNLRLDDYETIGRSLMIKKLNLSRDFLPTDMQGNWYELLTARFKDLESWVGSEAEFSKEVSDQGMKKLYEGLDANKEKFSKIGFNDLAVCIDCNSENLLFNQGILSFIDAYAPKKEWRVAAFDHDIFRTGSDVYALSGKEAYEAFLKGLYSVGEDKLDKSLHEFYLLYGAMIMAPYFYMLAKKNDSYLPLAEKYTHFIKEVLI
jgi:aminoglycoside phosphotransferase family enzyme